MYFRKGLKEIAKSSLTEKLRLTLSFFVLFITLCLLGYAISNNAQVILLIFILLIFSISDIVVVLLKIHRRVEVVISRKNKKET
jgi:uncharacterized protein (DUF58 family)